MKRLVFVNLFIFLSFMTIIVSIFYYYNEERHVNWPSNQNFVIIDDIDTLIFNEDINIAEEQEMKYEQEMSNLQIRMINGIEDKQETIDVFNQMAHLESILGKYKSSYNLYLKVIDIDFHNIEAWLGLGDVLFKMRAFKSSEYAYKEVISTKDHDVRVYLKLINLYKTTNREVEEIDSLYKNGFKKDYQNIDLLYSYADWLVLQGRTEKAINTYELLMDLDKNNKEAINKKIEDLKKN